MPSSNEIRQQFIDFFCQKHGHTNVPSSPVVPHDDPTLLFANAGMNQFKPYFLGTEKPPYRRVANTQKCIRAGGKHNDLDDVGKDTYHHTFFEMLGNWSFGDYFKKEAITWAWELLTNVWKLDPARLHVTVFEGDPANGIPRDDEAANHWRTVGVPDSHIHLGNKKDNFWEMGDTGPCGPCTEIHYDSTPDKIGAKLVNQGTDKVVEIWNNVFIQFNRNEDQSLTPLPAKHVDTGMGFERITKVLQGKESNYDTDVFTPILDSIGNLVGAKYGGLLDDPKDVAFRVIADHVRMLTFSISDGGLPGNKGRGAVIRSVLRRAFRFGYQVFGLREPFVFRLVPVVVSQMSPVFPELSSRVGAIQEQIEAEERDFLRTIERGLKNLEHGVYESLSREMSNKDNAIPNRLKSVGTSYDSTKRRQAVLILRYTNNAGNEERLPSPYEPHQLKAVVQQCFKHAPLISAKKVFDLHTTDGFPPDLTQQMAQERGLDIDLAGYKALMTEHEKVSRAKSAVQQIALDMSQGELPPTDDSAKYEVAPCESKVVAYVKGNAVRTSGTLAVGDEVALVLDRTIFYAEQGGQVGDTGIIATDTGTFQVDDTKRLGNSVLHLGRVSEGSIEISQRAGLKVSDRTNTMRNHTATHLLNLALRDVLGSHVEQKGSLVDAEKTRFDFSHDKPLSTANIHAIEDRVNEQILRDFPVTPITMPLAEAKTIPGVRAMFGEKYPDPVRVVMIGAKKPREVTTEMSVEFCGGTHLARTGPIGYFKIVSQEGVAKGVRRVTAITGRAALDEIRKMTAVADDLTGKFQCHVEELPARIESLQEEVKKLQQQLKKGVAADLTGVVDKLLDEAPEVNGVKLVVGQLPAASVDQMRAQIDRVRQKAKSAFITFGWADDEGKVPVIVALTSDLTAKGLKAGDIVKQVAAIVGGSGGGKPDLAQAGGKDASKLPDAMAKAREIGQELLKR